MSLTYRSVFGQIPSGKVAVVARGQGVSITANAMAMPIRTPSRLHGTMQSSKLQGRAMPATSRRPENARLDRIVAEARRSLTHEQTFRPGFAVFSMKRESLRR